MIRVNVWIVVGGLSVALLAAVIIVMVLASAPVDVSVRSGKVSPFQAAGGNYSTLGWVKGTNTTTASAYRSTDVTDVISVMTHNRTPYVSDYGYWVIEYTGYCLGMARSSGDRDKAAVLDSQLFKITHGEGDESRFSYSPCLGFGAWPHGGNYSKPTKYELDLGDATVAFAGSIAGFNVSGREFSGSLAGCYDQMLNDGPYGYYRWNYLGAPVADCGHEFYFTQYIPAGTTADFYFTSVTLGRVGESNVTLHFRFRVPPSPENMSPEELEKYGIQKIEDHVRRPIAIAIPVVSPAGGAVAGTTPSPSTSTIGPGPANDTLEVVYSYVANLTFEVD